MKLNNLRVVLIKRNVIFAQNYYVIQLRSYLKYMGCFCATKYIRTSISTAVITRITWWESYCTLQSGFKGWSFKLLGDLSGASQKGSTLHKPTRWVTLCTTSKQTLLYGWKWVKVSKGECETAAAGLAGLGSARKEDFQTLFTLNKTRWTTCATIHNNSCCRISYTTCFGVKTPSSGVMYCTTTKNSSTTILHEIYFGRHPALRAWPITLIWVKDMIRARKYIFQ